MAGKELNSKWNFVERNLASQQQGGEDSSFSDFVSYRLHRLVREYIQNSMDAKDKDCNLKFVKVSFSILSMQCADYPELILSLGDHFKACSDICKSYSHSKDPYAENLDFLNEHKNGSIDVLKVSDYNTTGMPYDDTPFSASVFKACVRSTSSSYKDSGHAGGSHGKGKTVGFVNSGLNAVYYSTKTTDGKTYGEGVIKLCDHVVNVDGVKKLYENVAFYDGHDGINPDTEDEIPDVFRRNEPGTDAYVLGFENSDDNIVAIKKAVLRNFFKAIFDGHLVVDVLGEEFNSSSVLDQMRFYFEENGELDSERTNTPQVEFNPRPYLEEVLVNNGIDDDHVTIDTNDFPGKYPHLGHAVLYVWKSDKISEARSRDCIVYMRDNNMSIEVKRGRRNKGYYGIFLCDGEGSGLLRDMENVTHDKWSKEELRGASKEEKRNATATLTEIKEFVSDSEKILFPEEAGKEQKIASLARHKIGVIGDKKSEDESVDWPSTNLVERSDVKTGQGKGQDSLLARTKKKKGTKKTTPGAKLVDGNEEDKGGENTPNPNPQPGPTPNPNPHKEPALTNGDSEETEDGENTVSENDKTGKKMREIKLAGSAKFLRPCRDGAFALALGIKVSKDYVDCRCTLMVQGVVGKVPLELKTVSDGLKIEGADKNIITGFDLYKDKTNIIKFTPKETVKNYTLIINAYGN